MSDPAPRPLLVVAAVVLAGATAMVFLGGWRTGVSWDETYHVLRMRNYLGAPGWYLLDGDLLGNEPGPWEHQVHVYAPVTMVLLHAWSQLWGVDGSGEVAASAGAFAVRHLGVGLLSLVALAAVAALARLSLRGWGWGLVAAAALAAMPAWTGQSMFNIKDVPVASGYTLVTLGLAVLAVAHRRPTLAAGSATAAVGVVLAAGTRPGIWPGLAVAALVTALLLPRADRGLRLAGVAGSIVAGVVLVVIVYPAPFESPFEAITGSVLESSRYGGGSVSRGYIPVYLVAEVPTLLLLLGGLGAVLAVRRAWRARGSADPTRVVLVLVLLQAFALPVLAMVRGSNLYDGLRQLLFAYPALAVLATIGISALVGRRDGRFSAAWLRVGIPALALVAPVVVQLQLFPYNYAYASVPAAALAPSVAARWPEYELPTDYWRTSVRELAPQIAQGGFVTCQPHTDDGAFMRWSNDGRENCATDIVGPLAPYDDRRSGTWSARDTEFLAVMSGVDRIGDNCTRLADVTRRMYWREVTMSYVASCELVVGEYPSEGLTFDGGGAGGAVLLGGWAVHHADPGVGVRGATAELGFTLPQWARHREVVLEGSAAGLEGMSLVVNGVSLGVEGADGRFRAVVPASVAEGYGGGRLLVTVSDDDHDLRLLSLRLADPEGALR